MERILVDRARVKGACIRGGPTVVVRLRTLLAIAERQWILGEFERAGATVNAALKLLDPDDAEHPKWIKSFREQLAKCREIAPR